MTVLRNRSVNTQEQTSQVIAASIQNLSQAGQGAMPAMYSLKRTVQRKRLAVVAAPPNPQTLADLVIPEDFTRYEREPGQWENFLLYDSGRDSGQNRILIFSTRRSIEILERSSHWAMDGTFSIAPPLFSQVYSIHADHLSRSQPLVVALLPNKRRTTYEAFLTEVMNLANNPLQPATVITDFEMAAIQAVGHMFPNASRTGCFFHLTKSIHRRIQSVGLQEQYENDANFAMQCRMISAIAFVPPAGVVAAFEALTDELPVGLNPILDYFEDNYIGRPDRRGVRRQPLFPIHL